MRQAEDAALPCATPLSCGAKPELLLWRDVYCPHPHGAVSRSEARTFLDVLDVVAAPHSARCAARKGGKPSLELEPPALTLGIVLQ